MSDSTDQPVRARRPASDGSGVLASLPKVRPQRSTARRTAARKLAADSERPSLPARPGRVARAKASSTKADAARATAAKAPTAETSPRGKASTTKAATTRTPVPRQGFESEVALEPGVPVRPPGRLELAGSLARFAGEAAHEGLSGGLQLLRGVLSRLPGV